MSDKTKIVEAFMEFDMPSYGKAIVLEGFGKHLFNAISKSKGDAGIMIKYLILELLLIKGKPVTEDFLDNMPIKDVSYLYLVIGTMLDGGFSNGF